MSDEILYSPANYASFDDIAGHTTAIQEIRNDINDFFNALIMVYEGQGAGALYDAHLRIDKNLENSLVEHTDTHQKAVGQHDDMFALDRKHAQGFS